MILYEKKNLWRPHQGCLLTSTYCTCIRCGLLRKIRLLPPTPDECAKNYAHMRTTCVAQFHRIVYRIHFALIRQLTKVSDHWYTSDEWYTHVYTEFNIEMDITLDLSKMETHMKCPFLLILGFPFT